MKKIILLLTFAFCCVSTTSAQEITLRKGIILDSIRVNDSISENFALYLPRKFDVKEHWPVLFLFNMEGKGKAAIQPFVQAGENQNYILVASNHVNDSLSITQNVLIASRVINRVLAILPIDARRIYTGGIALGGTFASIMPIVSKNIKGIVSVGGGIANADVLTPGNPFQFIGITSVNEYKSIQMEESERLLNNLRFSNQLFFYEEHTNPSAIYFVDLTLQVFTLNAMAKGEVIKDEDFILDSYRKNLMVVNSLIKDQKLLRAYSFSEEIMEIFRVHLDISELKEVQKSLRKSKEYKVAKRMESNYRFQEELLQEDYDYAVYEDVATYNFNNLGWWNFQMQEIKKFQNAENPYERQMGNRLKDFVDYLVDKNIKELKEENVLDEEGLTLLYMLNTITDSDNHDAYIGVISLSSKVEDYSTALFYLEELLKTGFTDKQRLYDIPNTALLRISPEYNALMLTYLKEARYDIKEQ
ncbi:alpha/beta hydrolase [Cellulophaga sp. E16_2]|uniref:alpha/beta hydrolase n=1 Tax=Cellulophaga sp. E16_2 TaxID=2789297 RepID=UPI001A92D6DF|nr:alpha/beta hydrolase [Cellulophaga sp. E16_2]MBO0590094.1 alpha/beta hydrolase [Cellulophaga sp. E16_2]